MIYKKFKILAVLLMVFMSGFCFGQNQTDLLLRAEHALAKGDTARATEQFRESLVVYPQSFAAAMRLAEIYYDLKDYHNAIQYCNIALDITYNFETKAEQKLYPINSPSKNEIATETAKIKQYKSDRSSTHRLKGLIRTKQLRREDAIEEFKNALEIRVESETLTDLALLYLEIGLLQDALGLLHKARALKPDHYPPYYNLANVHYKIQNEDSALYYYNVVREKAPDYKWPYFYTGLIQTSREEYEEAVENFSSFIALDSSNEEVYFRRAVLRSELRQWDIAIEDWDKVLLLNPDNAEAWRNKGLSHFQSANYESAIAAFDEALRLFPNEAYTYINRGYSYYLSNNPKQALSDLDKGLDGLPKYYLGYYFRALVHLQLKNKQKSCKDLNMAIQLGMKGSEVDEKLARKCR